MLLKKFKFLSALGPGKCRDQAQHTRVGARLDVSYKTHEKPSHLLVDLNTVENADSNSLFLQSVS